MVSAGYFNPARSAVSANLPGCPRLASPLPLWNMVFSGSETIPTLQRDGWRTVDHGIFDFDHPVDDHAWDQLG